MSVTDLGTSKLACPNGGHGLRSLHPFDPIHIQRSASRFTSSDSQWRDRLHFLHDMNNSLYLRLGDPYWHAPVLKW